ncbi:MAG TPA: hypothetical protein VK348_08580 [Planctomycetota bacterium]|nr:hypothetical protein [Planctomycetota bacterium]
MLLLGLAAVPPARAQDKVVYAVVANPASTWKGTAAEAQALVKKLFLKTANDWPDGTVARVYARAAGSAEQRAFETRVLGMTEAELTRHWLQQKNRNGLTPPREVTSAYVLIKYLGKYPEAFGVLPAEEAQASGLRVLFTF